MFQVPSRDSPRYRPYVDQATDLERGLGLPKVHWTQMKPITATSTSCVEAKFVFALLGLKLDLILTSLLLLFLILWIVFETPNSCEYRFVGVNMWVQILQRPEESLHCTGVEKTDELNLLTRVFGRANCVLQNWAVFNGSDSSLFIVDVFVAVVCFPYTEYGQFF